MQLVENYALSLITYCVHGWRSGLSGYRAAIVTSAVRYTVRKDCVTMYVMHKVNMLSVFP